MYPSTYAYFRGTVHQIEWRRAVHQVGLKSCVSTSGSDEKSQYYVTITTHLRLYPYTRLPFGVAAAPAIFQQIIDKLLNGLGQTGKILDDLIVTGENGEQHVKNLRKTL